MCLRPVLWCTVEGNLSFRPEVMCLGVGSLSLRVVLMSSGVGNLCLRPTLKCLGVGSPSLRPLPWCRREETLSVRRVLMCTGEESVSRRLLLMCTWGRGELSLRPVPWCTRMGNLSQGRGIRKITGTGVQLFFRGVPPEGEGGTKKNSRENFSRTPKPEVSLSLPHVFGFRRCKEGIFQSNHGYFSRYGWYFSLRAQRPPVCSGCSAAPHPRLLSARNNPQIRQYTLSGAKNRTSSIEGQE